MAGAREDRRSRRQIWPAVAALAVVVAGVLQFQAAGAETVSGKATVSREAYFTYPITQTTPPVLRKGFPPATACLVAGLAGVPQICGDRAQQAAALLGLTDGLPIPITPDGDLAQPNALPGTTPIGMFGGQPRYVSLLALNLPPLAAGERYGAFELVLHEDGLNFAVESPALRDLVLQTVSQLSEQDPQKVSDAITRALSGEVPLATQTITGIEACPITEEWNAGRGQGASLDGERLPNIDCVAGTAGVFDEKTRTWRFDITFAVQAWTEGTDGEVLPNQGIMLRPVGAPNLAYGDPDFSTNWVVSLADSSNADPALLPKISYTTVVDENASVLDPSGDVDLPGLDDTGDFAFPDDGSLGGGTDVVIDGGEVDVNGGGGDGTVEPRTVGVARSRASTPGWVWFVLPLTVILAYMFDQSLSATPAALRRRPGALTKLEMRSEQD